MFDLEDEFVIGSQRIPWLMWIQLLVMLLLLILLYHLIAFSLGGDMASLTAAASPDSAVLIASRDKPSVLRLPSSPASDTSSSRLPGAKVRGNQSMNNVTGAGTSIGREDIHEKEENSSPAAIFDPFFHPCHYVGLAKQAFLKCFGLDLTSKDSPNSTRQRKEQ